MGWKWIASEGHSRGRERAEMLREGEGEREGMEKAERVSEKKEDGH